MKHNVLIDLVKYIMVLFRISSTCIEIENQTRTHSGGALHAVVAAEAA
jgi:hypothetical protein